jgi:hypothetical protein
MVVISLPLVALVVLVVIVCVVIAVRLFGAGAS